MLPLIALHVALAKDAPSPAFRSARAVAITGSALGGAGTLLLGVTAVSALTPPEGDPT